MKCDEACKQRCRASSDFQCALLGLRISRSASRMSGYELVCFTHGTRGFLQPFSCLQTQSHTLRAAVCSYGVSVKDIKFAKVNHREQPKKVLKNKLNHGYPEVKATDKPPASVWAQAESSIMNTMEWKTENCPCPVFRRSHYKLSELLN